MDAVEWLEYLDISQLQIMFCKRFDQHSPIWNLDRHSHAYLELLFFLRGEAEIDADNRLLSPTACDMVIYLPGHEHREAVDLHKAQEIVCLWVDVGRPVTVQDGSFRISDKQRTLEWLFVQIEKEYRDSAAHSRQLVHCYLQAILLTASRYLLQQESENETTSVDKVRSYIEEHFTRPLSVRFLAGLCHVSPSYLHRIFRRQVGMSPVQYINRLRIQQAEYLLNTTGLTVAQVAERCGFDDSRYFSRAFRKHTGVSPCQYRANCLLR